MKFQFIFENFKALPNGTDAFKQLKILCEQEIGNNNNLDNSALFLIYGFAKNSDKNFFQAVKKTHLSLMDLRPTNQ